MKEYYVFPTLVQAATCLHVINNAGWFPTSGYVNGQPAPDENQKTTSWAEAPLQLKDGRFAIPRIPEHVLDSLGVALELRSVFMKNFGWNIQELNAEDFA